MLLHMRFESITAYLPCVGFENDRRTEQIYRVSKFKGTIDKHFFYKVLSSTSSSSMQNFSF